MKQVIFLSALLLQLSISAFAQSSYTEVSASRPGEIANEETDVNGTRVSGIPFLYKEWLPGVLTLKDGRIYTNYKLRYDALNQHVIFLSGTTSMEVNDEVKEFTIKTPDGSVHFMNGNEYKKESSPMFYEVIADDAKGVLLRANKKLIRSNTNSAVELTLQKQFNLDKSFYYFDKAKSKMLSLSKSKEKIKSFLGLTDQQADALEFNKYDFNFEKDLIAFFTAYFKQV